MFGDGKSFGSAGRVEAVLPQRRIEFWLGEAFTQVGQKSTAKVFSAVQVELVNETVKGRQICNGGAFVPTWTDANESRIHLRAWPEGSGRNAADDRDVGK